MHNGLEYGSNRGLLTDLATATVSVSNVSLNNNSGQNFITEYKPVLDNLYSKEFTTAYRDIAKGLRAIEDTMTPAGTPGAVSLTEQANRLGLLIDIFAGPLNHKRLILNRVKGKGNIPSLKNRMNINMINSANMNLNVLANPNNLKNAINNLNRKNINAAKNNNARLALYIQNAIHMIVFGLITVNGAFEVMLSYLRVSQLSGTTSEDEFLNACFNSINLISRVVLPIILGLINKLTNFRAGTKAVLFSSVAAVLVATQIDDKFFRSMINIVNNSSAAYKSLSSNHMASITKIVQVFKPEITNAKQRALSEAVIAARTTIRTILSVLFSVITAAGAKSVRNAVSANNRPMITNKSKTSSSIVLR